MAIAFAVGIIYYGNWVFAAGIGIVIPGMLAIDFALAAPASAKASGRKSERFMIVTRS